MTAGRKAGIVALAAGLLAALLLHGRGPAPPIFDGIVVPPVPYHWESPARGPSRRQHATVAGRRHVPSA